MSELCTDNRFELIEKYKQKLIDATNIEMAPDEMAVIDNILFRFWQMGWLDKLNADADPVSHGMWVINGEFIDCSVCKREKWSRVPYEDLVKRFKFCPNCGAKMDGERRT